MDRPFPLVSKRDGLLLFANPLRYIGGKKSIVCVTEPSYDRQRVRTPLARGGARTSAYHNIKRGDAMPVEVYNTGTPKRSHVTVRDRLRGSRWLTTILLCGFLVIPRTAEAQDLPWRHVHERTGSYGYEHPSLVYDHSDPTGQSWYTLQTGAAWHTSDLGVTMNPISQDGMGQSDLVRPGHRVRSTRDSVRFHRIPRIPSTGNTAISR